MTRALYLTLILGTALTIGGCAATPANRQETAQSLAQSSGFIRHETAATPFLLTSFERIRAPGQEAAVYIEGDGLAWLSRSTPSPDPTPLDPVSLRLAALDGGTANVIYLARPCQYSKLTAAGSCPARYWKTARFAPEVIESMNAALEDMKKRHGLSGFHLVGYSGGGGVVALLAARRADVKSLRTVAGNLDTDLFTDLHNVTPMSDSLNPRTDAVRTALIPQIHFVGAEDKIVPPSIAESFRNAAGNPPCLSIQTVSGARHDSGWAEQWTALLRTSPGCESTH